jgi:hypothetical protein
MSETTTNAEEGVSEDEAFLVRYLAENEVACPSCAYNLRGLTRGRCPECGEGVRLRVGLAVPYMRAWVTLAVAVCAGAGIGGFFLMAVVASRGGIGREGGLILPLCYFWGMIPGSVWVVAGRRRFMTLAEGVQRRVAGVVCAVTGVVFWWLLKGMF